MVASSFEEYCFFFSHHLIKSQSIYGCAINSQHPSAIHLKKQTSAADLFQSTYFLCTGQKLDIIILCGLFSLLHFAACPCIGADDSLELNFNNLRSSVKCRLATCVITAIVHSSQVSEGHLNIHNDGSKCHTFHSAQNEGPVHRQRLQRLFLRVPSVPPIIIHIYLVIKGVTESSKNVQDSINTSSTKKDT